jgi:hypothetical protein
MVDTPNQGGTAQVARHGHVRHTAGSINRGDGEISLSALCRGVSSMHAAGDDTWWETRDRRPGRDAHVAGHCRRTGVGDCGSCQHRVGRGAAQVNGCGRCHGELRAERRPCDEGDRYEY